MKPGSLPHRCDAVIEKDFNHACPGCVVLRGFTLIHTKTELGERGI